MPSDRYDNDTRQQVDATVVAMATLLRRLQDERPGDRSHLDRYYAIAITHCEDMLAHFAWWTAALFAGEEE